MKITAGASWLLLALAAAFLPARARASEEELAARRCVERKPALVAETSENLQNMSREIEEALGKPPPLPPTYSPQATALVCDERAPFVKKVQTLFDIGFTGEVLQYYTCVALARNDESACDAVKFIDQAVMHRRRGYDWKPIDARCRINVQRLLWSKALISGDPSAEKICRGLCSDYGPSEVIESDREVPGLPPCEKLCADAAGDSREPARFCEKLQPLASQYPAADQVCKEKRFLIRLGLGPCVDAAAIKAVGPDIAKSMRNPEHEPCSSMPSCFTFDPAYNNCLDTEALRKASSAHDKTLCGDSPICRAMMGGGAGACQAYAEAHRKWACVPPDQIATAAKKRREWERKRRLALDEKRALIKNKADAFNAACGKTLEKLSLLDKSLADSLGKKYDSLPFPTDIPDPDAPPLP